MYTRTGGKGRAAPMPPPPAAGAAVAAQAAGARLKSATGKLWEACIGLEVHAQIKVKSKLFSGAAASEGSYTKPNTHVALLDAALPGTLPVLNQEAVRQAVRTGLALGCRISPRSRFERKHYYYYDLPQGYQITQQDSPVATGGVLRIEPPIHENQRQRGSGKKNKKQANEEEEAAWEATDVRIARIQLEQDSGKSQHEATKDGGGRTLVDLNRAGTALMEIVFEPDLSSPSQAAELVRSLQATLRHLGTCDGNMDEGSIRCDLNVSVRPASTDKWGPRAEIKNLNSLKSLQTAAAYEIRRQIAVLESPDTDEKLMGETRSFNALTGKTARMRAKEGAVDYRFFPEPDLPPLVLSEQEIGALRDTLPELPQATKARLVETYGLTSYQASVLMGEVGAVAFFEEVVRGGGGGGEGKGREGKNVANWVCNDLFGRLKASAAAMPEGGLLQACAVTSAALGELIDLVTVGNISMRTAKEVLGLMVEGKEGKEKDQRPSAIVAAKGWEQVSDEGKLSALAQTLIADPASARQLRQYKEGKLQMLQYFVGQAMKATEGRANPELMERLLKEALK